MFDESPASLSCGISREKLWSSRRSVREELGFVSMNCVDRETAERATRVAAAVADEGEGKGTEES